MGNQNVWEISPHHLYSCTCHSNVSSCITGLKDYEGLEVTAFLNHCGEVLWFTLYLIYWNIPELLLTGYVICEIISWWFITIIHKVCWLQLSYACDILLPLHYVQTLIFRSWDIENAIIAQTWCMGFSLYSNKVSDYISGSSWAQVVFIRVAVSRALVPGGLEGLTH